MELNWVRKEAWRLFITAHARIMERVEQDLQTGGALPFAWYDVLLTLEDAPERRLPMGELLNAALVSRSGLTRMVDRIEAAGYLRREPCASDRRVTYLVITSEGIAARERSWPIYAQAITAHFARYVSDDEAEVFRTVLERTLTDRERAVPTGKTEA